MTNTRTRSAKFTLTVDLANEAFDPPFHGAELARVLRQIADDIEQQAGNFTGAAMDYNGNHVADYRVTGSKRQGDY